LSIIQRKSKLERAWVPAVERLGYFAGILAFARLRPILQPHTVRAREVLALMTKFAVRVSPAQKLSLCSDPDDDRFLECALAAEARYLVTGNLRHFPKDYKPVSIVTPRQLLDRLIADQA
jgi:predicted nucleic acid-binding protein